MLKLGFEVGDFERSYGGMLRERTKWPLGIWRMRALSQRLGFWLSDTIITLHTSTKHDPVR